MKKITIILCVTLMLFSCNKEKIAMNKLEGQWNVSSMTIGTDDYFAQLQALGITSITYDFENCGVEESCNAYMNTGGSLLGIPFSQIDTLMYSVSDDGSTMILNDEVLTINKLTNSELELAGVDSVGNATLVILEKL